MLVPALVMLMLFHFYPMWGILIAAKDYKFAEASWARPGSAGRTSRTFFASRNEDIIRNTVVISMGKIILGPDCGDHLRVDAQRGAPRLFKQLTQTATTCPISSPGSSSAAS